MLRSIITTDVKEGSLNPTIEVAYHLAKECPIATSPGCCPRTVVRGREDVCLSELVNIVFPQHPEMGNP
jgi:hypothetical protein